jgi:phospholipase/carboxylesterase
MAELLRTVEIEPKGPVRSAVIWLHGLGADGHDFEPLVPHLGVDDLGVRFVFPHAPRRAVSINMGLLMPAWFDIATTDFEAGLDEPGINVSATAIAALLARERERGVASDRIVLAGFSQGGLVAIHVALRHPEALGGALLLSTFVPAAVLNQKELSAANATLPIFLAHGSYDPMIPFSLGESSRDRLVALGHDVEWHPYRMQHEVSPGEINDISTWLRKRLS